MSALRVALNLLYLRPGVVGGTESYAVRLLEALADHAPEVDLSVICTESALKVHPDTIGQVKTTIFGSDLPPLRRVQVERTKLPRAVADTGADVVHHVGGTNPIRGGITSVCTIHDLQPLFEPANFSGAKRLWLGRALPEAVARSSIVSTPSQWVADTIIDRFDADPGRVRVVSAFAPERPVAAPLSGRVAERAAAGPFVLYPAMTAPHKNHAMLFAAFDQASRTRNDLQLICVGAKGTDHEELVQLALASPSSQRIHIGGHVSPEELTALYEQCERVVFPSRFEGFGLPVIEAQRLGVDIATSDAGALREVAGSAAYFVDPADVDGWVEVLSHPPGPGAADRVAAGRKNAERFSAAAMAAAQVAAYRAACDT